MFGDVARRDLPVAQLDEPLRIRGNYPWLLFHTLPILTMMSRGESGSSAANPSVASTSPLVLATLLCDVLLIVISRDGLHGESQVRPLQLDLEFVGAELAVAQERGDQVGVQAAEVRALDNGVGA